MKELTSEQLALLKQSMPAEALKTSKTTNLTNIKPIYVTERLTDVFGVGGWQIKTEYQTSVGKMVIVKVILTVPEYNIYYECWGGNENDDLGFAFKGAESDGIRKIASWIGIGIDVFKGETDVPLSEQTQTKQPCIGGHVMKVDPQLAYYPNAKSNGNTMPSKLPAGDGKFYPVADVDSPYYKKDQLKIYFKQHRQEERTRCQACGKTGAQFLKTDEADMIYDQLVLEGRIAA